MRHKMSLAELNNDKFTIEPSCIHYLGAENSFHMCMDCEDRLSQYPLEFESKADCQSCIDILNEAR